MVFRQDAQNIEFFLSSDKTSRLYQNLNSQRREEFKGLFIYCGIEEVANQRSTDHFLYQRYSTSNLLQEEHLREAFDLVKRNQADQLIGLLKEQDQQGLGHQTLAGAVNDYEDEVALLA